VTAFQLSPSSNLRTQIAVRLGNGDGTFRAHVSYILVNTRDNSRLHIADVNKDSRPDVLVSNSYRSTVYVLLANADGSLRFADGGGFEGTYFQGGLQIDAVGIADFDSDGLPDLAAAGGRSNFYVRPGNGDGTFRPGSNFGVGFGPSELAVADFNNDGRPDAAVTNGSSASISILLNTSNRRLTVARSDFAPFSPSPRGALSSAIENSRVATDYWPAPAFTRSVRNVQPFEQVLLAKTEAQRASESQTDEAISPIAAPSVGNLLMPNEETPFST